MKKTVIILLAAFYLIIASGVTFNLHYCGGKLKTVSLFSNNEEGCCGSKKKSKGCCKDKTTLIKVEDSHQLSHIAKVNSANIISLATLSVQLLFNLESGSDAEPTPNYHSPPVLYDNPLYLKNQVFLI